MDTSSNEHQLAELSGARLSLYRSILRRVKQEWQRSPHRIVMYDMHIAKVEAKKYALKELHDMTHKVKGRPEYSMLSADDVDLIYLLIASEIDSWRYWFPDTSGQWFSEPGNGPQVNKVRKPTSRRSRDDTGKNTPVRDYEYRPEYIGGKMVRQGGGFESNRRRH